MKIYLKLRLFYTKQLLKVYKCTKSILPKFSNNLKKHIERVSLKNLKLIKDKVTK